MAEETVDLKKFKKEQRRRERKEKFDEAVTNALVWVGTHKELSLIIIPAGVAALGYLGKGFINISKGFIRTHNLNKEQRLKDLFVYDRSLGAYLRLSRKLTQNEIVEVTRRKQNGESLAVILASMKVLA